MQNMIEAKENGMWTCCGVSPAEIDRRLYGALCKLKDYESTGLNPDGVERLKCAYADLAQRHEEMKRKGEAV